MCICILAPAGIVVSDDKLRNSYENNSDVWASHISQQIMQK